MPVVSARPGAATALAGAPSDRPADHPSEKKAVRRRDRIRRPHAGLQERPDERVRATRRRFTDANKRAALPETEYSDLPPRSFETSASRPQSVPRNARFRAARHRDRIGRRTLRSARRPSARKKAVRHAAGTAERHAGADPAKDLRTTSPPSRRPSIQNGRNGEAA